MIRYISRKYTIKRRRLSSIPLKREAISALDEPPSKRQRIYAVANDLNSEQVRVSKRTLDSGALPLGKRQKTCRSTPPPNSTTSRDEEPSPKKRRRIPNTNSEYIPDKTPLKTEYHRKKTKKKNVYDTLYFLNFMIKHIMTVVVYAVATYFVDAFIFLRVVMGCVSVVIFVLKYGLLP